MFPLHYLGLTKIRFVIRVNKTTTTNNSYSDARKLPMQTRQTLLKLPATISEDVTTDDVARTNNDGL